MNIPVDITALISAALDIEQARKTPVSVSVLIDETASPEFQVFVRSGFNSESVNSRVTVSYFPTQTPDDSLVSDVVVIAAGLSSEVGAIAAKYRAQEIPVLVVAESGATVVQQASVQGFSIPNEDVVSPKIGQPFDEEIKGSLADAIGNWIVQSCPQKRLAFSIAYPFVRHPLAYEAINATAVQNAGVGLLLFVPGADLPVMTLNQAKMVLQIAAAYGEPLSTDRIKELAAVLGSAFVFRGISRQAVSFIPALGWAIKAAMGYAGTVAIGHAAIEYFEKGGNIAGLASVVGKARDSAVAAALALKSQSLYQSTTDTVMPHVKRVADTALRQAAPIAKSAAKTALSSLISGKTKRAGKVSASTPKQLPKSQG